MAFTFNNITIDQIDSTNTLINNIGTFTAATVPALIDDFSIGNRIRITLTIDASGGDTFTGKLLRFNPGLFVKTTDPNAYRYGYESNGVLTTTATQANLNFSDPRQDNIYCEMSRNVGATTATITFIFYVTNDIKKYLNPANTVININRLISTSTSGTFNNSNTQTVYRQTENIGAVAYVFDYAGFTADVFEPGGSKYLVMPSQVRWYNSDVLGVSTGMRYIKELEITSASQIAAGLSDLTNITATSAQTTPQTNVLSIYTINSQQLSIGEDNSVRILLRGDAFVGSGGLNPAITDVRVLLMRTDNVTNTTDFVNDLSVADALIPQLAVGSAQIDGPIWTPSDWFENIPAADDIEVQFTLDGTALTLNGTYYIIVNIHDSVNPNYVTSHISPPLYATYTAPALPTITGYLSTYNKQYSGNELTIAPHQRIKARIEIDKASYATALGLIGLTGTWADSIQGIICKLTNTTGVVNQVQLYLPNGITSADMTIVTDDATDLVLDCIFRIAEEYAGASTEITWTITLNQPTSILGITQQVQINYEQRLDVDVFENDNGAPNLLAVRFYDLDDYLAGTKTEIVDICDVDQIIAEVEKDPAFTGSINLVATIYPASETGDANNASIEEEEDWTPAVIQMTQKVSGKLDDVETSFGGDDFATFRINVQQLTQGQRYWVTAIAYQQVPDYCPLIVLVQNTNTKTEYVAVYPYWGADGNPTLVINEILAHPDYIGGLTIIQNNITDVYNNPVGLQYYTGYKVTAEDIPTTLSTVYYRFIVDANFDSGSGTHLVRHSIEMAIPQPVLGAPSVSTNSNAYICTDLG